MGVPRFRVEAGLPLGGDAMFLALGVILLLGWLLGFVVFHVSSFLIHILILAALASFVFHLISGRKATA